MRAYSQAVQKALENLPRRDFTERCTRRLKVDFAGEAEARAWLARHAIPVEAADYAGDGVTLRVGWPSDTPLDLTTLEGRLKGRVALLDE